MEWKLFDADPPEYTTTRFFEGNGWVPGELQPGYDERLQMVADMVRTIDVWTVTDLGAGDGTLLRRILFGEPALSCWGYDLGEDNRQRAAQHGIDVRQGDILALDTLELGDLIVCTEVVEHLVDPHRFLRELATHADHIVVSSPSTETDLDHYEHHAWAWDHDGYATLLEQAGWRVVRHNEIRVGLVGFQAVEAVR